MSEWFRNLRIPVKVTLLLSLLSLFFIFPLSVFFYLKASDSFLQIAVASFSVIIFLLVFLYFIIQRALKPLEHLAAHLEQLGKKEDQERFLPVSSKDEIGRLSSIFNEMLQELDDDMAAQDETNEVFRIVTEFATAVIVWQLENGDIRYISSNCKEHFGYLDAEFYAEPDLFGRLIHPDDFELWKNHEVGSCRFGGAGLKIRCIAKDGSSRYFRHYCNQVYNSQGVRNGIRSSWTDIAEQIAAEEKMEELFRQVQRGKQEWEETLDHLHDFIILCDSNHHIKRYNRILSDMTGRALSDLVGRDWRQMLQEVGFRFINFNALSGELLHIRSARTYDINVYPLNDESTALTGFVISLNDTTELRATTQELEKTLAELNEAQSQIYQQEKMASIGQLAAGVAHEINNPMGFINSNLGSLDKYVLRLAEFISVVDQAMLGCCDESQASPVKEARKRLKIEYILEDAHQLISESQDGAARVRRIVQDLKSFSRVDQAETAFIDINEALETTINIAWNELKYVAELKREFGDIPRVNCFPQQLNQVFLNLLVNAAHAMGETRGEIMVSTEQEGDYLLVKVSDTGCGMPEEVQRRIFEPFFTTKEVGKGTGLGLSISYDIIKKHGGTIEVESEVGHGTTFTVRLPVADLAVEQTAS